MGLNTCFFVSHRYLGEEKDGGVLKKSRSQALLEKLQQKARERQSQSLTEQRQISAEEQRKQSDVKKKRKSEKSGSQEHALRKKSKLEEVPSPVLNADDHEDLVKAEKTETGTKEKKKKKKKEAILSGL